LQAARQSFNENQHICQNMMHWVKINVINSIKQMMRENGNSTVNNQGFEIGEPTCEAEGETACEPEAE